MWEAALWTLMVLMALFVFLSSFLPIVDEMYGTIEESKWIETHRTLGFSINRIFIRLIEYPEFFALGALGFLSLALLHYGLKKYGIKQTPLILILLSTLSGFIVFIGALTLMIGPLLRHYP